MRSVLSRLRLASTGCTLFFRLLPTRVSAGGTASECRRDDEVSSVRNNDIANQRLGDPMLVVVGGVDEVASGVGESIDDPLRVFGRRSVIPGLTEHPCAERELGDFQAGSFSKDLVAHLRASCET